MLRLSGLSLRDTRTPRAISRSWAGTGLRPSKKIFEELLIDAKREPTAHRLIYKANERAIPPEKLWMQIGASKRAGDSNTWLQPWRCWRS